MGIRTRQERDKFAAAFLAAANTVERPPICRGHIGAASGQESEAEAERTRLYLSEPNNRAMLTCRGHVIGQLWTRERAAFRRRVSAITEILSEVALRGIPCLPAGRELVGSEARFARERAIFSRTSPACRGQAAADPGQGRPPHPDGGRPRAGYLKKIFRTTVGFELVASEV